MVLARFRVRHYPTFQGVASFFFTFLKIYLNDLQGHLSMLGWVLVI